ncbi:MAG: hypothetical protein LBH75_06420 [Treponema sp.]|jgi:hypothetical protein|nr:hypothetical protein [Treponema sp.]
MQERLSVCSKQGTGLRSKSLFQNFLINPLLRLPFVIFSLLFVIPRVHAEEDKPKLKAAPKPPAQAVWYISNSAGMAVSPAPSRIVALRSKNCLALAVVDADRLPPALTPYYNPALKIDFRMLFENGKPIREQWVFRDEKGRGAVIAAMVIEQNAAPSVAFIERYNESGFIEEERLFDEKETLIKYFYKGQTLVRTETRIWEKREKERPPDDAGSESAEAQAPVSEAEEGSPDDMGSESAEILASVSEAEESLPDDVDSESAEAQTPAPEPEFETVETTVYTDYYRYSISASLRAVERVFQKGRPEFGQFHVVFPPVKLRQEIDTSFVKAAPINRSNFLAEDGPVSNTLYTTDSRGRVLSETQRGESGSILVETKNTWAGDRISVVEQQFFEKPKDADAEESAEIVEDKPEKRGEVVEERRVEYEYNSAGDRVLEKNYNNGVLERTVRKSGDQEIEEIYLDGKVVLRAVWEGNRKIKEERVK